MTPTLTKHSALRLTSLVLGLLYSYYIIYWHEVYVAMAVHTLEEIGLDAFNVMVMKVVLGISGLLCVFIAWRLRWQYKHQRRPPIILHRIPSLPHIRIFNFQDGLLTERSGES